MSTWSYSDVTRYQRCPMAHYYATVRQLQPILTNEAQERGIAAHQLLMEHYLDPEGSWWVEGNWDWERFPNLEQDEVAETYDMLDRYLRYYDDDWEILHVEENFAVELDDGTVITMTPDLIVRERASGAVWIVDHKTTVNMPQQESTGDESLQAMTYFGLLKPFFPDLVGFMFNYLRKKVPAQPRLTKTGPKRVAYLDTIDTTYEILLHFLEAEAPDLLDDPAHRQRLAELRENNRFFIRKYEYITDAMIENHIEDLKTTVEHMELSDKTGRYQRVFLPVAGAQSCTRCAFKELCVAELRGYDGGPIEEALFEPRDMSHKDYDHYVEAL